MAKYLLTVNNINITIPIDIHCLYYRQGTFHPYTRYPEIFSLLSLPSFVTYFSPVLHFVKKTLTDCYMLYTICHTWLKWVKELLVLLIMLKLLFLQQLTFDVDFRIGVILSLVVLLNFRC